MSYAEQNALRTQYARELFALEERKRSRRHDPEAAQLIPRCLEKWERLARAEAAQGVVDWLVRSGRWPKGPELDQWVERIYCSAASMNQPAGAAAAIPLGPVDALGGATTIVGYLQGELGITLATGVSAWASQIGGTTLDMAQATTTRQPAYAANNAGIWARSTVTGDGVDDNLLANWNPPVPGTTPSWMRTTSNRLADAASASLFAGSASTLLLFRGSATQVRGFNGTNGGLVTMTVGTWYRTETLFSNSVTDYLKVGSAAPSTGTSFGNGDAPNFRLFATSITGNNPGNYSLQKMLVTNAEPTALQKAILDGIDTAFYNGNITL